MVRFQRQPPGTAPTRTALVAGAGLAAAGAWAIVAREPDLAASAAAASGILLLLGGHRANHGAGGPVDRVLAELLDRAWDGCVLGGVAWVTREAESAITAGALIALCASFLSSYVRARGAALAYSVEESHVTRGLRYALLSAGLAFGWLGWSVWAAAGLSSLTAVVRTAQVAGEERLFRTRA
jgi:hypothetical protein